MSHSVSRIPTLVKELLCRELRGFHSFNFRLFMSVLYRTYHFWELKKMSFAYPSDMRHFLLLSTRLFPIRSLSEICGVRLTEWDFHPHFKIIR